MRPTQVAIRRRQFLQGLGVCMALPALESMQSAKVLAVDSTALATTASGAPLRTAFIYFPNGAIPGAWWPSAAGDSDPKSYAMSRTLKPLEFHRDSIQVLKGLDNLSANGGPDGGGDHARGNGTFLTGVRLKKSASDIQAGISIDQIIAKSVEDTTRFASLELTCDSKRQTSGCDSGYSCAYQYNISWSSATTPMSPESNPRSVFERLFGAGNPGERNESLARRRNEQKSVLDFVLEDARSMQRRLPGTDRDKLAQYLLMRNHRSSPAKKRLKSAIFVGLICFSVAKVNAQESSTVIIQPPMGIPSPSPATDQPYVPQPILPGGIVVPLYPPGSSFLKQERVKETEKYNLSSTVPGRISSIVNIHNPSIEVHMVRKHAEQWRIDPNKIGIMGFSAGAELSAPTAVAFDGFDASNSGANDPLAGTTSRPDFVGIIYPGPTPFARDPNTKIPRNAPPAFITCAGAGDRGHAIWANEYFTAMLQASIPNVEMHIYGNGYHPGSNWEKRSILTNWVLQLSP